MARGFTIIELMVVVGIVAILASIGVPAMRDMVAGGRVREATTDFYTALAQARSEAIKRRTVAKVEPLSSSWSTGWKVTVGGTTYATVQAPSADVSIIPTGSATTIQYGMNGRVTAGQQTVVFYSAAISTIKARCVTVTTSGMPRMRLDSNTDANDGCN